MKQIDEQGYKDGGAAFNKGKSLRSLFESYLVAMQSNEPYEKMQGAENYHNSALLGFADAFITHIRRR